MEMEIGMNWSRLGNRDIYIDIIPTKFDSIELYNLN